MHPFVVAAGVFAVALGILAVLVRHPHVGGPRTLWAYVAAACALMTVGFGAVHVGGADRPTASCEGDGAC